MKKIFWITMVASIILTASVYAKPMVVEQNTRLYLSPANLNDEPVQQMEAGDIVDADMDSRVFKSGAYWVSVTTAENNEGYLPERFLEECEETEVEGDSETDYSQYYDQMLSSINETLKQLSGMSNEQLSELISCDDESAAKIATGWLYEKDKLGAYLGISHYRISEGNKCIIIEAHASYEYAPDEVHIIYRYDINANIVTIDWIHKSIEGEFSDLVYMDSSEEESQNLIVEEETERRESPYEDGLMLYKTNEYSFITNEDLDTYGKNMIGAKIYIVSDVDDMKDNLIQTTLNDGFMMSSFDVSGNYERYSGTINKGDTVAILGTVSGYNDYSFMGHSIDVTNCLVIATGDDALQYKKDASDEALRDYFIEPKEPQAFEILDGNIYEGHGTKVTITDVIDGGSSFDLKVNIVNDSDLNLGFNARAYGINGIMTGNNIYDMDCDVAAHREANTVLKLKKDFLEEHMISEIKRIDLLLWAYDNDKYFKEFDSGQLTILTDKDDGNYSEMMVGDRLYEKEGMFVDFLKSAGNECTFIVTNQTGEYFDFDINNLTINGYTSSDVDYDLIGIITLNGCQSVFTVKPDNEFLEMNGIDTIDTVEFTMEIRPRENYYDVWTTDMISYAQ